MDEKQSVSLWFSYIFLCDVFSYALEYLSGICGSAGSETGSHIAVDMEIAVELGISWNSVA